MTPGVMPRPPLPPARTLWRLVAAVSFLLLVGTCTILGPEPAAPTPEVEVELLPAAGSVRVEVDGAYAVVAADRVVAHGDRLTPGVLRAAAGVLELNGVPLGRGPVRLEPEPPHGFRIDGTAFPGALRVTRREDGTLRVTNCVDLESYVAGVLFAEMPASFPDEALRAQAVAARTYAWWRRQGGAVLRATEADQVYRGLGPAPARARSIVESTRGQVLEYAGRPLPAFYSSTCGGSTADGGRRFDVPLAPLAAKRCGYCKSSPRHRWSRTVSAAELVARVGAPPGRRLEAVRLEELDAFGRPGVVVLRGDGGELAVPAARLREQWNRGASTRAEALDSSFWEEVRVDGDRVEIHGRGFGHGVGLCQYGARGLAEAGRDHRAILAFYYPGGDLVRRW